MARPERKAEIDSNMLAYQDSQRSASLLVQTVRKKHKEKDEHIVSNFSVATLP